MISFSEDGDCVAQINGKGLIVHSNPTSELRNAEIVKARIGLISTAKFLKISEDRTSVEEIRAWNDGEVDENSSRHLLCANDDRISAWQLQPFKPLAQIEGVDPSILGVDFGSCKKEITVFHAWNTKLTIFSLDTGHSNVIKAPKFSHGHGFGYRPRTGQFAIILKPETADLLTIHETRSYQIINHANIPTVDAQGLKWSPDGKWIAVWEAASAGTKVLIFTADGHHFRTYTGPPDLDDSYDLGVRCIEWSPYVESKGASEYLTVGKVDGTVDILRSKTVYTYALNPT